MKLIENANIVSGFVPVNLATGANTGDLIDMSCYNRVLVVFFAGAGTAGDDPTITIKEHTALSGGTSQDLVVVDEIYVKQGTQTGIGQFTRKTQAAAATYTDSDSAENEKIWAIEIRADQMSDGFRYLSANVSDVGNNSQLGCLLYIQYEPRYAQDIQHSSID